MKPKFEELTEEEQGKITDQYIRRERPIGERGHLKRMLAHLKKQEELQNEEKPNPQDEP